MHRSWGSKKRRFVEFKRKNGRIIIVKIILNLKFCHAYAPQAGLSFEA